MSVILLGFAPEFELTSRLAEELKTLGFETHLASSGYEVIRECLRLRPAAVLLENGITECDILKTTVWLRQDDRTSSIPQFLINRNGDNGYPDKRRIESLADKVCSFNASFSVQEEVEEIAVALKDYEESIGLFSSAEEPPPTDLPSKGAILADLAEAFEERYIKSRLMLRLFQVTRNLDEVDYFVKSLLMQVATIFNCEIVSFLWKSNYVTEYNLIASPVDLGIFEALRRHNQRVAKLEGWGRDEPKDLITWGRKLLRDGGGQISEEAFSTHSVSVDIKFRNILRGRLTLVSQNASPGYWDREMLTDFQNQLALIFSNFIMYHDLETNLSRDNRIFQSIRELAGISTLELGSFRSFLLQSLLILLDLYSTTCGAVVILDDDNRPEEIYALGESENFFRALASRGRNILEIVLEDPAIYTFGGERAGEVIGRPLDTEKLDNLIAVPLQYEDITYGILLLTNIQPFYSVKEIKFLAIFAKQIANQIHSHKTYSVEHLEKRSLEEQLTVARDIQKGLLPKGEFSHPYFDFYAKSVPAKEVGGDFFDYYPLDEDWVGVAIADISGKGMPASLLMSVSMTIFRSIFENEQKPAHFLAKANAILAKEFFPDKFVTALFGMFGPGVLKVASGGHHPIIVYRASENIFEHYEPEGMALGIIDSLEFEEIEIGLSKGDVVIFFTDGLCEASNPEKEQFGYQGIERVTRAKAAESAKDIVEGLFEAVEEHTQGVQAFDDTTVIVAVAKEGIEEETRDGKGGCEVTIL
jgi:sigma-B regulation protein RsbU (phosphoserine phosphatase)